MKIARELIIIRIRPIFHACCLIFSLFLINLKRKILNKIIIEYLKYKKNIYKYICYNIYVSQFSFLILIY